MFYALIYRYGTVEGRRRTTLARIDADNGSKAYGALVKPNGEQRFKSGFTIDTDDIAHRFRAFPTPGEHRKAAHRVQQLEELRLQREYTEHILKRVTPS